MYNLNNFLNKNICVQYSNDNNTSPISKEPNDSYEICGTLLEIKNDYIWLEDNQTKEILVCSKCNVKYWGENTSNRLISKDKGPEEGKSCKKTLGCDGILVKKQEKVPKKLFLKKIKDIKMNEENNFISVAKLKKDKEKYEKIKQIWNPNNEATYDYWAELYGRGMNAADREIRQDFADAMTKNY